MYWLITENQFELSLPYSNYQSFICILPENVSNKHNLYGMGLFQITKYLTTENNEHNSSWKYNLAMEELIYDFNYACTLKLLVFYSNLIK